MLASWFPTGWQTPRCLARYAHGLATGPARVLIRVTVADRRRCSYHTSFIITPTHPPTPQDTADGFLVDVWTKAEFIKYFNENSTSRPVKWIFLGSGQGLTALCLPLPALPACLPACLPAFLSTTAAANAHHLCSMQIPPHAHQSIHPSTRPCIRPCATQVPSSTPCAGPSTTPSPTRTGRHPRTASPTPPAPPMPAGRHPPPACHPSLTTRPRRATCCGYPRHPSRPGCGGGRAGW